MIEKFYLDGKCILSYDAEVFSSDEDYCNIMELLIHPLATKVYQKYYQKELVEKFLEQTLKENDVIYQVYSEIKSLIEKEDLSVEYLQEENETLLTSLMRERLDDKQFADFEKLYEKAGTVAWNEEMKFLGDYHSMAEHFWNELCDKC
ncbi:MAG: hypothetical protein IJ274_01345 [Lachnospiraceae bacterium]|nr:hypothetical protein [Lachnospiraceae bacterium]